MIIGVPFKTACIEHLLDARYFGRECAVKAKKHVVWFQQAEVHKRPAALSPLASTEWGLIAAALLWQKWFLPRCLNSTNYRTSKLEKQRPSSSIPNFQDENTKARDVWLSRCRTMRTRAGSRNHTSSLSWGIVPHFLLKDLLSVYQIDGITYH